MIKLTYKSIKDPAFTQALSKLANHGFRDQILTFSIAKVLKKFKQEVETAQGLFLKLIKEHALLDEKGEFVPDQSIPGTYQIRPEQADAWKKAQADFEATPFELACNPIRVDQLQGCELSAMDLLNLEPMLVEPEQN